MLFCLGEDLLNTKLVPADLTSAAELSKYLESRRTRPEMLVGSLETAFWQVARRYKPKLDVYYHIFPFPVDGFDWHMPDFFVPQFLSEGRPYLFDPHHFGSITDLKNGREVLRWTSFHRKWDRYFHHVIINSNSQSKLEHQMGVKLHEFADELWEVPNHGSKVKEVAPVIKEKFDEIVSSGGYSRECSGDTLRDCIARAYEERWAAKESRTAERMLLRN
jgi:hypothetical protein